jgi:hypothetical protein
MKAVGYKRRDPVSHRKYNWKASITRYKKTGKFSYVKDGSGHRAGEKWGADKEIDPQSTTRRYSKNSPSFDEGVYQYKQSAKAKALTEKMS